jgi:hypothetical protein
MGTTRHERNPVIGSDRSEWVQRERAGEARSEYTPTYVFR